MEHLAKMDYCSSALIGTITGTLPRNRLKVLYLYLKLISHDMLHYLCSANLSKTFSQLILSIFTFLSQKFLPIFFFNKFQKCGITPHCLYRDSLTLIVNFRTNFHVAF